MFLLILLYHLFGLVKGFPKRYHTWWLRDFSGVWDNFLAIFGHFLAILFYFWQFFLIVLLILLYHLICLVKGFPKRYHTWWLHDFSGVLAYFSYFWPFFGHFV